MGFSLDFSQLEKQYDSIVRIENSFNEFLKRFLIDMANRILLRTIRKTPVDTGDLRRSWILGDVHGHGKDIEVEILNGMEYATEIEYGHRIMGGEGHSIEVGWYEGRFMLKTSTDEIKQQIPLRWQREFKMFCDSKGLVYD